MPRERLVTDDTNIHENREEKIKYETNKETRSKRGI